MKLNKNLKRVLVTLALITVGFTAGKQQGEQILTLINRVDRLENLVRQNAQTVHVINKLFWIITAAAAAAISGMLFIQ